MALTPIFPVRLDARTKAHLRRLAVAEGVHMAQVLKRLLMHPKARELLKEGRRRGGAVVKSSDDPEAVAIPPEGTTIEVN